MIDILAGTFIESTNKKKTRADYIQHHLIIFLFVPVSMAGEQQTNNRSRIMSTHYVHCWQVHVIYIWNKQKVWRYKKMEPFAMQLMWDISIFFESIYLNQEKKQFCLIIWQWSKVSNTNCKKNWITKTKSLKNRLMCLYVYQLKFCERWNNQNLTINGFENLALRHFFSFHRKKKNLPKYRFC